MKTHYLLVLLLGLAGSLIAEPKTIPNGTAYQGKKLLATAYDSGFPEGHDSYNGMSAASDGKIYYVLCSDKAEVGAQMFCFDPETKEIRHLGDLTEASGERGKKLVAQGKSHVKFVETNGKLYFATHLGYYQVVGNAEEVAPPPPGYKPYAGGHLLSYDLKSGTFEDLGIAVEGEGIITMNMDVSRGRIFGLTWPSGRFFRYDLATKEWKHFGQMAADGEVGKKDRYRTICRSLAVNPVDGSAYFTTAEGTILRYHAVKDAVEPVIGVNLKKDYFGQYDPAKPGSMGYNWRQTVWHPTENVIYGMHGNSGYLFRFDPAAPQLEVLGRLTSEPSQRGGMYDQFWAGYLGFELGPDQRTLYYLTGGPIYVDGERLTRSGTGEGAFTGLENLHLVTWHIPSGKYTDHGAAFYADGDRPLYVNSIAIDPDGAVYSLGRSRHGEDVRGDLFVVSPTPASAK